MGGHEASGLQPNGLVHNAGPMMGDLGSERWMRAEERIAELISCIQPNQSSEERRHAVADYVQRLITRCFPCQVFTFGSVPLKTYLPDGDIDVSTFSNNQNLKETWAYQVRDMLESEEHNKDAEFRVNEVQYIQAEVKIIKCLVENVVVDISFNQLGGLCTLCFLEEVDHLIGQNHLFKRSIILIKAWCYYESRILGAHHGLISTYALETLVLYIFHVFNNSFTGPLEVLYRFLEFFSNFDWDNFCVSLWGPVPISSLPNVTVQPPRKDGGDLLLSKNFLDACSSVYSVFPGGQENQGPPFLSKHLNVIDPLRFNNNLGRSVSRGNFYRIRSAFAFGAKRLARLLDCPEENLLNEVNQFFFNTWDRHGSGDRPDAPHGDFSPLRLPSPDQLLGSDPKENFDAKMSNSNSSGNSHNVSSQRSNCSTESAPRTTEVTRAQSKNGYGTLRSSKASEKVTGKVNSNSSLHFDKGKRSSRPDNLLNEIQGKFLFARTRSSPELTDTYRDVSSRKSDKGPESGKTQPTATREEINRTNLESELPINHSIPSSTNGTLPVRQAPHQAFTAAVEAYKSSSGYARDRGSGAMAEELSPVGGMQGMHQEEQDLVNMMATSTVSSVDGQFHMPLNLASGHLPMPVPPSILASMGFAHRNFAGMFPPNMPFIDPSFANMQFPQGFIPPPLTQYFPGMRVPTHSGNITETGTEDFGTMEMNAEETNQDFWQEQGVVSSGGLDLDDRNCVMQQSYDNGQSGVNLVSSSQLASSVSSGRNHRKFSKENHVDIVPYQDNKNDIHSDDRTTSSRFSSESSWDGSSVNGPNVTNSTREKRGKATAPTEPSTLYGKGMIVSEQATQLDLHGYELAQTSGSESMIPFAPIMLGPDSRQRMMDNPGGVPFAFYPTGPPVPFLTMLPFYNVATDNATSETSASHFAGEEGLESCDSGRNFAPSEEGNTSNSSRAAFLPSNEVKPDILNSDFISHWKNLQIGRYCQNPGPLRGPLAFPSPAATPPVYLPGRFPPWDGPGRPQSANMNIFTQLMGYGPRMFPVAPLQSVPNRPPNVYQRFADEMPRQRSGTGTYLPHHKVPVRDRHSPNTRKANHNHDKSDSHGDREGNWNSSTKSRSSSRSHNRNQSEKSNSRVDRLATPESRADRSWNSYRHDLVPPFQPQNGPPCSSSSQSGPSNVGYGMHPLPSVNPNGSSANGPPVVMVHPYDRNPNYGSHAEQLQFGSLPVSPSVINDRSQVSEGNRPRGALGDPRFRGGSQQRFLSDQPSSPRIQRLAPKNYQLKEEDFPPLASPNQAENDVWEKL